MTAGDDWPDPLDGDYELRVTRRALDDLGAAGCFAAEHDYDMMVTRAATRNAAVWMAPAS